MAGKTRVSVKTKTLRGKAIVEAARERPYAPLVFSAAFLLTPSKRASLKATRPMASASQRTTCYRRRSIEYSVGCSATLPSRRNTPRWWTSFSQLTLTGCRRGEMIRLKWTEADTEASCLRLEDSKEGESIRPIGLPVVEYLERRLTDKVGTYVFPGQGEDNAFGSFPNHWKHLFENPPLSDVTPHVLRHSSGSRIIPATDRRCGYFLGDRAIWGLLMAA
jgi:integrase